MNLRLERQGWWLRLRFGDAVLMARPPWEGVPELERRSVTLVVLDVSAAEFVSTVFLEGCVELARSAASHRQKVVLLGLSKHHRRVLSLLGEASRMTVLDGEQDLADRAAALVADCAAGGDTKGVSGAEKMVLWQK
jgi:hypothetical protein